MNAKMNAKTEHPDLLRTESCYRNAVWWEGRRNSDGAMILVVESLVMLTTYTR